jgi:hypothetical protein
MSILKHKKNPNSALLPIPRFSQCIQVQLASKEPAVEGCDGSDGCGDGWTLDVDVALRGGLVHIDVQHAAVLVALLYHVIANLLVPVGPVFSVKTQHIKMS